MKGGEDLDDQSNRDDQESRDPRELTPKQQQDDEAPHDPEAVSQCERHERLTADRLALCGNARAAA